MPKSSTAALTKLYLDRRGIDTGRSHRNVVDLNHLLALRNQNSRDMISNDVCNHNLPLRPMTDQLGGRQTQQPLDNNGMSYHILQFSHEKLRT